MEPGYIRGGMPYLTWTDRKRMSDIGSDRLEGGSFIRGAHLPAFRCMECKLLMANYESYDEKASKLFFGPGSTSDQK